MNGTKKWHKGNVRETFISNMSGDRVNWYYDPTFISTNDFKSFEHNNNYFSFFGQLDTLIYGLSF